MSEEADVALLVEQTGVLQTVESLCTTLRSLADVTLCDYDAVYSDADVVTLSIYLLCIPLAYGLASVEYLGSDNTVN